MTDAVDVQVWECPDCPYVVVQGSNGFGLVGWMADIARHTQQHEEKADD